VYRLRTFGGLGLERDGSPLEDALVHRKSLALLALVDLHGQLGRERLMAFLWPESRTERARGSLKQAIHLLRRRLDAPDLLLGTVELRLNPERIRSDAGEFLEALERGDPSTAVELYRGPFLDGVHLDGTDEFQRWAEGERDALARRHREALESLARGAGEEGELEVAVRWWRRLQHADPLSTRVALELMDALERAGDRAGALRHGRVHEVRLQEELGLSPDPVLLERMERLREGAGPSPARTGVGPGASAFPPPLSPGSRPSPRKPLPGPCRPMRPGPPRSRHPLPASPVPSPGPGGFTWPASWPSCPLRGSRPWAGRPSSTCLLRLRGRERERGWPRGRPEAGWRSPRAPGTGWERWGSGPRWRSSPSWT
jgi:DNA-binding SARP family transcriptional activator